MIRLKWGPSGGAYSNMNGVLIRREDLDPDRRDAHTQEGHVRTQPEVSPVQAKDQACGETTPAHTLTLDF